MDKNQIIENTTDFVKKELENDTTGHDFWHINRVDEMAKKIAKEENGNIYICELAALLHDVADDEVKENITIQEYRNSKGNAINHFYEKLLKLKYMMNTNTGKILAEGKHKYLENFLEQFYSEWKGKI